jgi:hypothetical protein
MLTNKDIKEWAKQATEGDLRTARETISFELNEYAYREKINVYKIFVAFEGSMYFFEKANALKEIKKMIELGQFFEDEVRIDTFKLTKAEAQQYCSDYPKD